MQDQVTALVAEHVKGEPPETADGQLAARRAVAAVISGAVLRAARAGCGESRERFAARAGVPVEVVAGPEDGALPAWALPYPQYEAMEAAVGVVNPGLREVFAAAACCDLFLTGLLGGDAEVEDGALAVLRREHADLAFSLLIWAVTGTLDGTAAGYLTVASSAPLLPAEILSELAGLYVTLLIDGCECEPARSCRAERADG